MNNLKQIIFFIIIIVFFTITIFNIKVPSLKLNTEVFAYKNNENSTNSEGKLSGIIGNNYLTHITDIGGNLGFSVAGDCDINTDGISDYIATDTENNTVNIYYGMTNMPSAVTVPDIRIKDALNNNTFGIHVECLPDINADGYDDIAVGAHYAPGLTNEVKAGKVSIFFGGPNLHSRTITTSNFSTEAADITIYGNQSNLCLGHYVYRAGDVNNDTYNDLIFGGDASCAGGSSPPGSAYIIYGGPGVVNKNGLTIDVVADVTFTGETNNDQFGYSLAGVGDLNGDNIDDIVVGARYGGIYKGKIYIFYGSTSLANKNASTADVIYTGETISAFGNDLSPAGDVNGDGLQDIIVGAPIHASGSGHKGRVYIFLGGNLITGSAATADYIFSGEINSDTGYYVSGTKDINNDGFDDVIMGSQIYNSTGRAYIFFGGSTLTSTDTINADIIFDGSVAEHGFTGSLNFAGDINNDGWNDILIGTDGVGIDSFYLYSANFILPSPIISNIPQIISSTNNSITGTGTSLIDNISGIQARTNTNTWINCLANDGNFDSLNEPFTCELNLISEGSNNLEIRTLTNRTVMPTSSYATSSFIVDLTGPNGSVLINNGDSSITSFPVTLTLTAIDNFSSVSEMMISENSFFTGAIWETFNFMPSYYFSNTNFGTKTIYVKLKDSVGNESSTYFSSINYTPTPISSSPTPISSSPTPISSSPTPISSSPTPISSSPTAILENKSSSQIYVMKNTPTVILKNTFPPPPAPISYSSTKINKDNAPKTKNSDSSIITRSKVFPYIIGIIILTVIVIGYKFSWWILVFKKVLTLRTKSSA